MAPIDRASWRRQTSTLAEDSSSKLAGGPPKATEGNPRTDSPSSTTATRKSPGAVPSTKGEAAPKPTGTADDETSVINDATSTRATRSLYASRETEASSTKEPEAPTAVDIPVSTITSISRPTSTRNDDSSTVLSSSPPAELTSTADATTRSSLGPVTTSVAAPSTTQVVVPPSPSPPVVTSGPTPRPGKPGNGDDNTPSPTPPSPGPIVTSSPAPPVGGVPRDGQGNSLPVPSASAPAVTSPPPPGTGGPGNGPRGNTSVVNPSPSAAVPASPVGGGQANGSSVAIPPSSTTPPAPPANGNPGNNPGTVASSSVVVDPPVVTTPVTPPPVASTTSNIPAPPVNVPTGVPTLPESAAGGSGNVPSATTVAPTPATTRNPPVPQGTGEATPATPSATETRLVTDINNGAAGPQITSLPTQGVKEGAIAGPGAGDETSFTEIPFTTNTIVSASETTFISGGRVFTSSVTFLSTQVLSTRVPVPTNGVIAGIGDSSSSKKTGAMIGGAIGGAIILLAVALCALFIFRRRRHREQELRTFLSAATPEPFFSPPLHSASPSPPPFQSGSRLLNNGSYSPSALDMPYTNNGALLMAQTTQSKGPTITSVRKKPVPFLEFPVKRPLSIGSVNSSLASSSMSLNPVDPQPIPAAADDPFADPACNNPFEDPACEGVPTLVLLPATPVNDTFKRTSATSDSTNSDAGSSKEYGFAI